MARVLVVEDNAANLKLATLLLESAGHTVISAPDAEVPSAVAGEHEVSELDDDSARLRIPILEIRKLLVIAKGQKTTRVTSSLRLCWRCCRQVHYEGNGQDHRSIADRRDAEARRALHLN